MQRHTYLSGLSALVASLAIGCPSTTSNATALPEAHDRQEKEKQNRYGLISRIENLKHGIQDRKYVVDWTLVVENPGPQKLTDITLLYSLCFQKKGKDGYYTCVDGGQEKISLLEKNGGHVKKNVRLKRLHDRIQVGTNRILLLRGLRPIITIEIQRTYSDTLYKKNHELPPIGNYK